MLAERSRLEPSLDALCRWLEALGEPALVAMEATLYWHWLERQLTARGFKVLVAHPYQVKLIWQARTKTDPIDARKLAELARVNLLPSIWIPDPATRALRQLLRGRVFLVRQRTVMRNRIHAYQARGGRRGRAHYRLHAWPLWRSFGMRTGSVPVPRCGVICPPRQPRSRAAGALSTYCELTGTKAVSPARRQGYRL